MTLSPGRRAQRSTRRPGGRPAASTVRTSQPQRFLPPLACQVVGRVTSIQAASSAGGASMPAFPSPRPRKRQPVSQVRVRNSFQRASVNASPTTSTGRQPVSATLSTTR
jgi:hypothetical protein